MAKAMVSEERPVNLSPRVRGKPVNTVSPLAHGEPIPACAGETFTHSDILLPGRTYPRVCGGNEAERGLPATGTNLSPRVRGKRYGRPGAAG